MHHDIGLLNTIIDKSSSLIEVPADIKGLVIVSRNIESVRNILSGMTDLYSLRSRKQSSNLQFYFRDELLFRVLMFYAASRLPM